MAQLKNEFSWSKSRESQFRECLRAYYCSNYGSWGGWEADASPEVKELYVLKNLKPASMWVGVIVHEAAERAVRSALNGLDLSIDELLRDVEERMRQEFHASLEGAYRTGHKVHWAGKMVKVVGLQEHHFKQPLELGPLLERVQHCVRVLYQLPIFRRFRSLPQSQVLSVEALESVVIEGVKVWIKMDAAIRRENGQVVILDWKTGASGNLEEIRLQLGVYGLYAREVWKVSPSDLRLYDVNLRDGAMRDHGLTDDPWLDSVKSHIVLSANEMRSYLDDIETNTTSRERFPRTLELWRCRRCAFRAVCERA